MWSVKVISPLNINHIMWESECRSITGILNQYRERFPNGLWLTEAILRNVYLGRNKKDKQLILIEKC